MVFRHLLLAVGVCACFVTACQSPQPNGPSAVATADVRGQGAAPPSHYRAELLREAMAGLRYDSGRVEINEAVAGAIAERGSVDAAMSEYERGQELLRQNRRIQAIGALTKAVLIAPDQALVYEGLGAALLAKQKAPEAIAAFRTALDLNAGSSTAHFGLARALQAVGRFEESVEEFREVVRLEPDCADTHSRLAILSYYLEDDPGAWGHVHRVEALGSSVPPQFRELLAQRTPEPVK